MNDHQWMLQEPVPFEGIILRIHSTYTIWKTNKAIIQSLSSAWVYPIFLSHFLHQMNCGRLRPTHPHLQLHRHRCSMKRINKSSLDSLTLFLSMMMKRNVDVYPFSSHLMNKSVVFNPIQQSTKATKSPICHHRLLQQATWCHRRHPIQVHPPLHHRLTAPPLQHSIMACYLQAVVDGANQAVSYYQKKKSGLTILRLSKNDAAP